MTERRLCWAKTRSTATAAGPNSSIAWSMPCAIVSRRSSIGASGDDRMTL